MGARGAASSARLVPAVLIIAGGRGARFWPASRANRPKPLFSLDGRTTLIADTVARQRPLVARGRIFVLVPRLHRALFRRALHGLIPSRNLLVEPAGRGTAVAVAYGAALIRRRLGECLLCVMPADHHVTPAAGYRATLRRAIALAAARSAIVVIGVKPRSADPGYGYQEIGRRVAGGFKVQRFVEKPPLAAARRMVRSGRFLWNAGMFVMRAQTLTAELGRHCPALAALLERFAAIPAARLPALYRGLDFDAFDRELVERSSNVFGVRADFEWHDVGSWQGLWEALRGRASNVLTGNVLALDSSGVLARSDGRLVVLLGVEDLVVVEASDAVLIARRSRSQDIRRVTDELERRALSRYL